MMLTLRIIGYRSQGLNAQVDKSIGRVWASREFDVREEKYKNAFSGLSKFDIAGDPEAHAGEDAFVGIFYSWQIRAATYGPIKVIPPGKHLGPDEIRMTDAARSVVMARKHERLASYREMQAISSYMKNATGLQLDSFVVPDGVVIRPVDDGEVRVVDTAGAARDAAYIIKTEEGRQTSNACVAAR